MKSRFYNYANLLIDNIEGGYYSPIRHYSSAMGKSGETMFGMDRAWGGSVVNDSVPGKEFWKIVDANSTSWAYGSKGGKVGDKLRKLAAEIMGISYDKYSNMYLSDKARKLVAKSPRLETHFYYACWNGPGRFQAFADAINNAVKAGKTNLKELEDVAIQSRLNHNVSLIRTGGQKMKDKIWPQLPEGGRSSKLVFWVMGGLVLAGSGYYCYHKGYLNKLLKKIKK